MPDIIIFKVIEHRNKIPYLTGMFQKEVAERICHNPGSKKYGILSVLTQLFYKTKYLFSVNPSVFDPQPKIKSGVIELTRKKIFKLNCNENQLLLSISQCISTNIHDFSYLHELSIELTDVNHIGQGPRVRTGPGPGTSGPGPAAIFHFVAFVFSDFCGF